MKDKLKVVTLFLTIFVIGVILGVFVGLPIGEKPGHSLKDYSAAVSLIEPIISHTEDYLKRGDRDKTFDEACNGIISSANGIKNGITLYCEGKNISSRSLDNDINRLLIYYLSLQQNTNSDIFDIDMKLIDAWYNR